MAKSSTSFRPGQSGNKAGNGPLTEEQRLARDLRARCQPELVKRLLEIVRTSTDNKDVIAAAKILVDEMPVEVRDVTERAISWVDGLTFDQAVAIARLTSGK
jgi:hypothetical protein